MVKKKKKKKHAFKLRGNSTQNFIKNHTKLNLMKNKLC